MQTNNNLNNFVTYMSDWNPKFSYNGEMFNFVDFWEMKAIDFEENGAAYFEKTLFDILDSIKMQMTLELIKGGVVYLSKINVDQSIDNYDRALMHIRMMIKDVAQSTFKNDVVRIQQMQKEYFEDNGQEGF